MKLICIGNYPPRQCGIATFSANLLNAIRGAAGIKDKEVDIEVIAMNDGNRNYDYPPIVSQVIHDDVKAMYEQKADYINNSGADVCLLQHEYGIFGGASGVLLLGLLRRIKIPVVSTFHTVLLNPTFHERETLKKIAFYSSKIVIMNGLAIGFLKDVFDVHESKIVRIQHGVPDFEAMKEQLPSPPDNWKNRMVMLTFGLIGRSKGIETAIKALPEVVKKHPQLLYVVVGKTHPNVVKLSGEEYREMLKDLTKTLQLENHVQFIDRYLSEEELMAHLLTADLYVTPYHNIAQITSGTLSYAVAGGCAVLSTPYWHAEELLADGMGVLFEFGDTAALAEEIDKLIEDKGKLATMQQAAYNYGKTIAWPLIGGQYIDILEQAAGEIPPERIFFSTKKPVNDSLEVKYVLPVFDPAPLLRLTDDTGILQHANGCVPCYKTGYCLDDNSRALVLALMAHKETGDPVYEKLAINYLSFIRHTHIKDGIFINYLTYDRNYHECENSDDAYGRALWALGYLIRFAPNDSMMQVGLDLFYNILNKLSTLQYARGYANSIFGLYHYTKRFPDQERFLYLLVKQAEGLCSLFKRHSRGKWRWFEDRMTYDNGLLPAALYKAYQRSGISMFKEIADESGAYLESKCFINDHLSLIGNKKWLGLDENYEIYAQQPLDALAMIELYDSIYQLDKSEEAAKKVRKSFLWFLGYNDLDIPLYDAQTKGCNDGIEVGNINRNQGAESNIAYLTAHLISKPYFV